MPNETLHKSRTRFSLRELFVVVAFIAMAIVSLMYASTVWQIVLGLLVLVVFIGALVAVIVDRGPRQAFAIGMVAAMGVYQAALIHAGFGKDFNREFLSDGTSVRLPTTQFLRSLHTVVVDMKPRYADGKLSGTVIGTTERPVGSTFMSVGHCWWALLLGYASGHFAQFLYLRRTSQPEFAQKP